MAPVREVAFELECFEWADDRLEVAGRWKGLGPRRLSRPVLTVETEAGRRKRIVALPGGQMGGIGETWRASFSWPGDPGEITGAALEVGGNLVVDLPLPDRKRRRRRRPAPDPAADEALRAEVGALRGQVERLRAELAGREREIIALRSQLDEVTDEEPEVERAGADERTVEIQRLAGELERLRDEQAAVAGERTVEIQQLARERDEARAELSADAERRDAAEAHYREEVDSLREAFSEAAAEVEASRERHRAELAQLQNELRAERAEVARLAARLAAAPAKAAREPEASGPPTEAMPAPDETSAAGPPTQPMSPPDATEAHGSATGETGDPTAVEAAVLDAPGPMLAGGRPVTPAGAEKQPRVSRAPAWLRGGDEDEPGEGPLHALKERFGGMLASNGHATEEVEEGEEPIPRPRRSAAAARARAEATVAARRSPAEVWGMRVLAAIVVAVLLITFVLVITSIA
jgi:hypothetical protein